MEADPVLRLGACSARQGGVKRAVVVVETVEAAGSLLWAATQMKAFGGSEAANVGGSKLLAPGPPFFH